MNMHNHMGGSNMNGSMANNGTNHGSGGMHHGSGVTMHHMMQMYFFAGKEVTILFKEWKVDTVGELIGSMIALIFMGILYEGIKVGREILKRQAAKRIIVKETIAINGINGDSAKKSPEPTYIVAPPREMLLSKVHFLQTFLHMIQVFIGYMLMLAFMTFNAWICLAVILGAGLGYFAFGWKSVSIVDIGDHCL